MIPGKIVFTGKTKKNKQIIIRYAKKQDVRLMTDYMNALSKEKTFISFQGERLSFKKEKKYLDSFLVQMKKNEAVKLLVFHSKGLVGMADVRLKDRNTNHVGGFGLTVAKNFRDEGIGKLLMKLTLEEAKKNIRKLRIIDLSVFANNTIARRMYQKRFGFKEYGCLPGGIKRRGKFVDLISMYKKV
ncbi:MAG: GNAT family N-acetyltransferase [bacterium]|nr:GNAT family N-acetyltransferase [bacterium]